jgi:hypothetical protein
MADIKFATFDEAKEWAKPFGGYWFDGRHYIFIDITGATLLADIGQHCNPKKYHPTIVMGKDDAG